MAKQVALNRVRDAAGIAEEKHRAWEAAQLAYAQALQVALTHATGDEVAAAAGRSRVNLYRSLRRLKRPS